MFAPASFDDAASRFLERTPLPRRLRWDPTARAWAVRSGESWTHVHAEYVVTMVARFLADEFAAQETLEVPVPEVLSGVRKAPTWPLLRAKVTRQAANAVVRLASGSPAFYGLPDSVTPTAPEATAPDPVSPDESVAAWVRSATVDTPGTFLLRSAVTAAFKAAHGDRPGLPSRQVVSRVAQDLLGAPRKRDGQYGWPDVALAS